MTASQRLLGLLSFAVEKFACLVAFWVIDVKLFGSGSKIQNFGSSTEGLLSQFQTLFFVEEE